MNKDKFFTLKVVDPGKYKTKGKAIVTDENGKTEVNLFTTFKIQNQRRLTFKYLGYVFSFQFAGKRLTYTNGLEVRWEYEAA